MAIRDDFVRLEAFCNGPFAEMCTPAEFSEIFGLDESTVRHAIRSGRLQVGVDCFKFGKQWVLSRHAFGKFHLGYGELERIKGEYRRHPERGE